MGRMGGGVGSGADVMGETSLVWIERLADGNDWLRGGSKVRARAELYFALGLCRAGATIRRGSGSF